MCLSTFIVEIKIYKCFDNFISLETLFKFLDMSKVFEWVWHGGFASELNNLEIFDNSNSFLGNEYENSKSFLGNKYENVAPKGQIIIGS